MNSDKNIQAVLVFEIIGRPPEHLIETLKGINESIGKEKGITAVSMDIKEPILMKEQKDFYTSFAEIEIKSEDVLYLAMILFKYMPAHVEIISPQEVPLKNSELGEILSEIARKLHAYDEIARVAVVEKNILEKKLKEVVGKKDDQK